MINICFTGHRSNKLGGYDWHTPKNKSIIKELKHQIIEVINSTEESDFHFICGGALGVDQMAFDILENIKYNTLKFNPVHLTLEVAIPFLKQNIKWQYADSLRWHKQLNKADIVTEVDKLDNYKIKGYQELIYYPAKMQKRNEYMVDNSDVVIAIWDGVKKGGTYNCVKYAQKSGKKIIQINPKEIN